jgi:hypothetical protein
LKFSAQFFLGTHLNKMIKKELRSAPRSSTLAPFKGKDMQIRGIFSLALLLVVFQAEAQVGSRPSSSPRNFISERIYKSYLERLTGIAPLPSGHRLSDRHRAANMDPLRSYLHQELQSMGYSARIERFDVRRRNHRYGFFGTFARDPLGVNFVVEIPGQEKPDEIVVLGAHYDSTGINMPGADDNGSGASAILAVARAFSKIGLRPKRTIRLVLFDTEEYPGLYRGSAVHFDNALANEAKEIVAFFNLDMIGSSEGGFPHLFHDPGKYLGFSKFLENAVVKRDLNFTLHRWGLHYSDQQSAWWRGIPAASFFEYPTLKDGSEGTDYAFYHQRRDTFDKVNTRYASQVTGVISELVAEAADSQESWAIRGDKTKRQRADSRAAAQLEEFNFLGSESAQGQRYLDRSDLPSKAKVPGLNCEIRVRKR